MSRVKNRHLKVLEQELISCDDIENLFGDYVDEDLPTILRARLDSHLFGCKRCKQFAHEYYQVILTARELQSFTAPTDVQNRLRQALNVRLGLSLPYIA